MSVDLSRRAALTGARECRSWPVQLEVRKPAAGTTVAGLEGYASVVERGYDMWDSYGAYTEVVRGGAFAKTLGEAPPVQLLLNHGGLAMAYTRAGSLVLQEDSTGLHMSAQVNAERSDVRDMLLALDDGAVDEMSFAFRVTRQQWSPDYDQRDIIEVDLHRGDVSVVNFGANPATSVSRRSSTRTAVRSALSEMAQRAAGGKLSPADTKTLSRLLAVLAAADAAIDPITAALAGADAALDTGIDTLAGMLGMASPDLEMVTGEAMDEGLTSDTARALLDAVRLRRPA